MRTVTSGGEEGITETQALRRGATAEELPPVGTLLETEGRSSRGLSGRGATALEVGVGPEKQCLPSHFPPPRSPARCFLWPLWARVAAAIKEETERNLDRIPSVKPAVT